MSNIKQTIDDNIYQNGQQKIRGDILNNVLNAMVDDSDEKLTELASKTAEIAPNENTSDLDINDEQNNTLVRFKNGGVKTKYFDSETTPSLAEASGADLFIADEKGKVLMQIAKGHIKTKKFDSSKIPSGGGSADSWLKGKVVAVIGDSISTKINMNAVEIKIETEDVGVQLSAYLTKYDVDGGLTIGGHTFTSAEIGNEVTFVPTNADVGKTIGKAANKNAASIKTWWEHLEDSTGCSVIPVSWSGASITSHESTKESYKTSYAWHPSQIRKCGIRTSGTMERTAPDVVIIYRGTNDMTHTSYTRLTDGYFDDVDFAYPSNDVVGGNYGYKEGLVLTIAKVREAYPNAIILLCTLNYFKRINYSAYPTNNGINTLSQYNNAIREVANYMGCGIIEFDKDGVTYENCETYAPDLTHPNNDGHLLMGNKAIADINKYNS